MYGKVYTRRLFLSSNAGDRFPLGEARTDRVCFDFNSPIICRSSQQILLSLESFSCPNVLYNIPTGKNILTTSTAGVVKNVVIPIGQYNSITDLTVALQTAITAQTITLTVSFNTLLNKFIFQNSGTVAITIQPSTAWYRLGLLKTTDLLIGASETITLPRMADLSSGRVINFAITNHDFAGMDSHGNTATTSSVLASIPLHVGYGAVQTYSDTADVMTLVNSKNISDLNIALLTLDNDAFDIGGCKWTAVLKVSIVSQ